MTPRGLRRCCAASSPSAGACATRRSTTPPAATPTSRSTAQPASDDVLTPGFTDYDDTVQYTTADLTRALKPGVNALGAELGRGFYGMTGGNVWRWESPPWHDEPVVRARLRIEYADGRVQDVITDDGWTIADGPTVFDDLYAGETYDARLRASAAGTSPGFDDGAWAAASEVAGPKGVLVNQRQQPIRVTESLPAVEITEPVADTYVVKFPRVLAGWVEFAAPVRPGPRSAPSTARSCWPTGCRTSPTTAASAPASRPTASSSPAPARPSAGTRSSPTRASSTSRSPAGRAPSRRR